MKAVICGPYPYDAADQASGGGLMQAVCVLANALASTIGDDVQVLSRSPRLAQETTETRGKLRVTWVPDPSPRGDYLLGRRLLRNRLVKSLERLKPDVVNAHGEAPFIRAALELQAPHVVTLHGIFARQTLAYGPSAPLAYRFAFWQMRRWEDEYVPRIRNLIAINSAIAEYVQERAPAVKIFRVNNAVDPAMFAIPDREESPTILFLGQISRLKGLDILLAAFSEVVAARRGCRLRIVGGSHQDTAFQAQLEARFAEFIRAGSIQFLGPRSRDEVADELSRCSLLCLPSLYEASPLVIIEAMAAAKPVVASRVGDIPELLEPSGAGIVVDPKDAGVLAAALNLLLGDERLRRSMGERGRAAAVRRASPEVAARATQAVFETVLGCR